MLALPFVFYRVWRFVVPGLLQKERSLVLPMAIGSMILFCTGAAAAYFYLTPLIVRVLMNFLTPSIQPEIRLSALFGFFYNLALACGLVCQLPLVTMTLTALGLVTPRFLLSQWRFAVAGVFLLTAIITPGDIVTAQVVMAGPMTLLYFASVGLSALVARRVRAREREEDAEAHALAPLNGGDHA